MKRLLLAAALCASATPAFALFDTAAPGWVYMIDPTTGNILGSAAHPLNVTGGGGGGGSTTPFVPGATAISPFTATGVSSTVSIPAGSTTLIVSSSSGTSNIAHCTLGAGPALTSDQTIQPGASFAFNVTAATQFSCITSAGSQIMTAVAGSGALQATAGLLTTGTGSNASVGATGSAAPTSATYDGMLISGGNMVGASGSVWGSAPTGLNVLGVNADILSSVLPTGAATAANQEVTSAGTSATSAQGVQGVTGGVPQTQIAGPNVTTTGTINTADTGQTCSTTNWGNQTACTGTPTAGSAYQVAVSSAGYLWVQAVTTGGTPTVNFAIRISNDGGTTWFNRGIFELTNVAPFQLNNIVSPNFAGWLTGGVTNVEVIATTYTGAGSTGITITQGQATPFVTSSATSSSLNGSGASAATNIQGNGTSALPVNTDLQQIANVAIGAPTAAGTSASGNIPAIQGVTGGVPVPISGSVTASFSQFAPNGNYSTPLTVGSSSARTTVPAGGGSTVAVYNTGANAAFVQLGNSSVVATASDDQVGPGGFLCLAVGANTNIAAIETAGATTINVSGGSGGCAGSAGATGSATQAANSAPINISTATTTTLVSLSSGKAIYVTAWDVIAGGTGNITLEYGTGSNCAGGTTVLTGAYPLTAQNGIAKGSGIGPVLFVPASNALCALTSAGVQMSGSVSYAQF